MDEEVDIGEGRAQCEPGERGPVQILNLELGVTFSAPGPAGLPYSMWVGPEKEPLSFLRGFNLPLGSLPAFS